MNSTLQRKLIWPGLFFLVTFAALPLALLIPLSFATRSFLGIADFSHITIENYLRVFQPLYLYQVWNSLIIAGVTTFFCALLAYPLALFISRRSARWRVVLLALVLLPYFTSFLARTYAWFFLLRPSGFLGQLQPFGLEITYLNTRLGVVIGLVYSYLPLMTLPLFVSLQKIHPQVLEAASDLGASAWQRFRYVVFPLSLPGLRSGILLVFVPCLGEFVTPKMLGGGKVPVLGTLIEEQFFGKIQSNWPYGAALTLLLMIAVLVPLLFSRKETA